MDNLDMLYDLCEIVSQELDDCNDKIRKAGGKLTSGDVDYLDKLTHTLKSLKTTTAMMEAENGYSGNGSYGDGQGSYYARGRRGGSYYTDDGSYDGDSSSYARGRGRNARRDSMGRYSRNDDKSQIMEKFQEMMDNATDDRMRSIVRKAMDDLKRQG